MRHTNFLTALCANAMIVGVIATGALLSDALLISGSPEVEAQRRRTGGSAPKKPKSNLGIPKDLPEKASSTLTRAVAAYKEAYETSKDRSRKLKSAIRKLRSATANSDLKEVPVAHFRLGAAYNQLREYDDALAPLQRAVELNPKFHEAWVLLAEVFESLARVDEAEVAYESCLKIYPTYRRAVMGKVELLTKLGKYKDAGRYAKKMAPLMKREEDQGYMRALYYQLLSEVKGLGWKKEFKHESDNYIVRTSVSDEFSAEMANHLELIRLAYMKVFPNIARPPRKYEVVVHKSKSDYHRGGGPMGAAGHYSPLLRKLVLYKNPKKADTLIVLYHEAFHQYLHEYLKQAPQWFNEGLGDYFAPFEYGKTRAGKRYMASKPNPWRLRYLQQAIRYNEHPDPETLMKMSREEMYGEGVGVHYAMAWSLIYFCLEEGSYKKILVKYFHTLRDGKDIGTAYDESFGKVDMADFAKRWRKFTLEI